MMALITLDEAKEYLRIDSADEDAMVGVLLSSAQHLCVDVARIDKDHWADLDSDKEYPQYYERAELEQTREVMRIAILYALGYLYEHREEADHHELLMTLRSITFAIREGVF